MSNRLTPLRVQRGIRSPMRRLAYALVFVSGSAALALVGCKQSEGAYCQVNNDCASGLVCIAATSTCGRPGTTPTIDAAPDGPTVDAGPDAHPPDARPIDAM